MSERQFNEVTCDICGKKKVTDIGKCPVDMCGKVVINYNVFYENREREFSNVCRECTDKIVLYIGQLADDRLSSKEEEKKDE